MANVAAIRSERVEAAARLYLGPADVVEARPGEATVRMPGGAAARAQLALAYAYEPRPGDVVLVISHGDGCYVIGVLRGTGRAVLAIPGDVEIRAVDGVLRLAGDKGLEMEAPDVSMRAGKLRVLADAVVERLGSLRQRVTDLLSVQAGRSHTVVEGTSHAQSKSAAILTEEKVTINGREIHLG
jgi:hypothetical protein